MKLAALALLLFASCSVSAAPPGDPRVTYTVDFAAGSDEAVLQKVVEVYKQRLGKRARETEFHINAPAATITAQLAVSAAFEGEQPARKLAQALPADARTIQLTGEQKASGSALARIDDEWIRVDSIHCERGLFGSTACAHEAGGQVQLLSDDNLRSLLEAQGEFEFLEQATNEFLAANQTTIERERERFEAWRKEHPAVRLKEFDKLARELGGPVPDTLWRRHRSSNEYALLMRSADPRFRFSNRDIASTGFSQDSMGYPALSFELAKERMKDFSDWTKSILGHGMAIVLDDEILTLATVRSRLPGSGIIEGGAGGFSKEEVKALAELLKLPLLPLPPLSLQVEFLR